MKKAENNRYVTYLTIENVIYKTEYGTRFKIDGDKNPSRILEVRGNKDYILHWLRDKLRKMENGQIKVVGDSSGERDWEQEEKIKKQLWEDINVNAHPKGINFDEIICTKSLQTQNSIEYKRPPSPCKIS